MTEENIPELEIEEDPIATDRIRKTLDLMSTPKSEKSFFLMEKTEKFIRKKYPEAFLNQICTSLRINKIEDIKIFSESLIFSAGRYFDLKTLNINRISPSEQDKILNQYKNALKKTQEYYRNILSSSITSGKLSKATRGRCREIKNPAMIQMFSPYCEENSLAPGLLDEFLGELINVAESARHQNIGNDQAKVSETYLTEWVTAIGKIWSKYSEIRFSTGAFYKELDGYKSEALPILQNIISKLEPSINKTHLVTILRKISKNDLINQPLANFFIK